MIAHENFTCSGLWLFRRAIEGSKSITPVHIVIAVLNLYDIDSAVLSTPSHIAEHSEEIGRQQLWQDI